MAASRTSWQLKSQQASGTPSPESIKALALETGLSALTVQVCVQRELTTREEIAEFLSPRLENLTDPFLIQDMRIAVDRVVSARAAGQKVRVFGDYDVDGTTGAALLSWVFRDFGISHDVRQPDRFRDGYGLNVRAVEEALEQGVGLLITVDCGITSFDALERARELGLAAIVVDHHQVDPARGLPPALAVLNPQRSDCQSGLKQLCGCGLAFYLARALRTVGREQGWFEPGREPNLKRHLDLVVMATAADMVPLTGDNHILVRHGLEVLKHSSKPGVKALLDAAGVGSREVSPGHLGFTLGPRINASGRMASATLAFDLLTSEDPVRAQQLAQELEKLNSERAELQNQIWDEVRREVETRIAAGEFKHGIAVSNPGWHEGVVGIVASKVTETFKRPAAVISIRDGSAKGSVRSYAGKDVLEGLRRNAVLLKGFGGHKHAAGLSLDPANLPAFALGFDQALGELGEDRELRILWAEAECSLEELDLRVLRELEALGPFGPGNPEPLFVMKARIDSHRVLKGRHLKLELTSANTDTVLPGSVSGRRPAHLEAIWFHAAEDPERLETYLASPVSEWAGVPELNRFRGVVKPSFRVKDWRGVQNA